jgi:hypothetical protein
MFADGDLLILREGSKQSISHILVGGTFPGLITGSYLNSGIKQNGTPEIISIILVDPHTSGILFISYG